MTDFTPLLQNPELAKSVRIEITGEDLLSMAGALAKAVEENARERFIKEEQWITTEQLLEKVSVNRTTIWKWHNDKKLCHNSEGLYKLSEVNTFLARRSRK